MPTHQDILKCPMQKNDAKARTVGEYLAQLLATLWYEGEGFSGKRPFGNSAWEYEIYEALARAGFLGNSLVFDEDGYVDSFSQEGEDRANELIQRTIRMMGSGA